MINLYTVIGARPQFIKAAVISRLIQTDKWSEHIREKIIHTGQHYDANMSGIFFDQLEIPRPDFNLNIGSGTHGKTTGEMLGEIEEVLIRERPDALLVYGDTNSTFAGAFAASKLGIPVFHVEAGLRSYSFSMPEEQNRILTDHLSSFLFCPTDQSVRNLKKEGIERNVFKVGDVMLDASKYYQKKNSSDLLKLLGTELDGKKFVLATIHRAENTDSKEKLQGIINGLGQLPYDVVLPLHPRTKTKIEEYGTDFQENIKIIPPVSYLEMIDLESNCDYVVTDSGGIQKEAYFFDKPCFTTREQTEWVELVDSGWNVLVGTDPNRLIKAVSEFRQPINHPDFYGDGAAGEKILAHIVKYFK